MPARTRRQFQLAIALVSITLVALLAASTSAIAAPDVEHEPGVACNELATYTVTGAHGDVQTVAITAQSLEAGRPGWGHVSWEVAPSVTVTAVVVTGSSGTSTLLEADLSSGTVEDVLAITFCGAAGDDGPADGDPADATADATTTGGNAATGAGGEGGTTAAAGDATEHGSAGAPAVPGFVAAAAVTIPRRHGLLFGGRR